MKPEDPMNNTSETSSEGARKVKIEEPVNSKKRNRGQESPVDMDDVCGATWVTVVTVFVRSRQTSVYRNLSMAVPEVGKQRVGMLTEDARTWFVGMDVVAVNVKRLHCMVVNGEATPLDRMLANVKKVCLRLHCTTLAANDAEKKTSAQKKAAMGGMAASAAAMQVDVAADNKYTCYKRCGDVRTLGGTCATCNAPCYTRKTVHIDECEEREERAA